MPVNQKSKLYNADLAPVPQSERTWSQWNIAALWVGMAVCIPTYTLASSLVNQGMNWKQAVLTIFLANVIILIPMTLNAFPGTKYGIPFPVLLRASFGIYGSNVAALMRGLVACGWFGIQTWIGGSAIYVIGIKLFGITAHAAPALPILGISLGELLCFLIFWAINLLIILRGIDTIRWMENIAAPFLLLVGLGLLVWAYQAADGFGNILNQKATFSSEKAFRTAFLGGLTANIGFWSTLSLNIPDFSRFARSQKAQIVGQTLGLPTTMAFYSAIGILVTGATMIIYGREIRDPVELLQNFDSGIAVIVALIALTIATLSTNIAANVVSPANDFSNLFPRKINFKLGGIITCIIGIIIMPWKLYQDPNQYIFTWLIGYSALLGPIAGIMIADYFIWRKQTLDLEALFDDSPTAAYHYTGGFSLIAFTALLLGILPNLPGFLIQVHAITPESVPPLFQTLFTSAWFVGFFVAFGAYLALRFLLDKSSAKN